MNNICNAFFFYIRHQLKIIIRIINELCNPPFCIVCKTIIMPSYYSFLCDVCDDKITPIVSIQLALTPTKNMTVFAIGHYQDPLKKLILSKMYSDISVSCALGHLMWDRTYIRHTPVDVFVPIALHWRRYAYRGYNQSYEMAKILSNKANVPCVSLLKRQKNTAFQYGLKSDQRKSNLAGAFVLNNCLDSSLYTNKHIVLVDDLMTTGVTLQQAAQTLLVLKPKSITAIVVSRVT